MRRLILVGVLLSFFWTQQQAHAAEYLFVTLEYPPLEYTGEDGAPQGVAVDLVTRIMDTLGHTVEIRFYPWELSLAMVKEGKADAIFTAYKNPERERFLDYSRQVLIPQLVSLYAKQGTRLTFAGDFATLQDRKIGVVSTISYGEKFDQYRSRLRLQRAVSLEQSFRQLLRGEIDLVISNSAEAETVLQAMHLTDAIIRLPQPVEKVPSYIAFSKQRHLTTLRDRFDQELARLKASGEYDDLLKQHNLP